MNANTPNVVVIGGPNGAGKTTIARDVLDKTLNIAEFVNADMIAEGLSGFDPARAAFAAGRVMLARLHELSALHPPISFAFESTLASRTFAPWLTALIDRGFEVHVLYVWLRSPELAIRRIKSRVRKGGHDVPEDVIRRRFARSAANLLRLYLPLAATWRIYDNSERTLRLIALGERGGVPAITNAPLYRTLQEIANGSTQSDHHDSL